MGLLVTCGLAFGYIVRPELVSFMREPAHNTDAAYKAMVLGVSLVNGIWLGVRVTAGLALAALGVARLKIVQVDDRFRRAAWWVVIGAIWLQFIEWAFRGVWAKEAASSPGSSA